jgi:hypothetical protein
MEADGLFGHVNDAIRTLATDGQINETWEFLCECPDPACHALVTLTLAEFDRRRAASPRLPIRANHGANYAPSREAGQEVSVTHFDGNAAIHGG